MDLSSFLFLLYLSLLFISPNPITGSSLTAGEVSVLSSSSRWIVDQSGRRVKLACANWAAHLEPVVAEGLSKQPVDDIAGAVRSMGFNCVRLTWPVYLATRASIASLTVDESLRQLGLVDSAEGVAVNNPQILNLTLIEAFKSTVRAVDLLQRESRGKRGTRGSSPVISPEERPSSEDQPWNYFVEEEEMGDREKRIFLR